MAGMDKIGAAILDKEGERVAALVAGQQVIDLAGALRVLRLVAGTGQDDVQVASGSRRALRLGLLPGAAFVRHAVAIARRAVALPRSSTARGALPVARYGGGA